MQNRSSVHYFTFLRAGFIKRFFVNMLADLWTCELVDSWTFLSFPGNYLQRFLPAQG